MRLLWIASALLMAGCAATPAPAVPAPDCQGARTAIVRNNFSQPVDIYAYDRAGRPPFILGTVTPGEREEFSLPVEMRYVHFKFSPDPRYRGPRPSLREVLIEVVCR